MQFTPEQKADFERQRAQNPDQTSFRFRATDEQKDYLRQAAAEELADRDATIEMARQIDSLQSDDSIRGAVRRAMAASDRSWQELGETSQVAPLRLEDFYFGRLELSIDEIERVSGALDLHLVLISSVD